MTDQSSSILAVPLSIDYTSRDFASLRNDLIARVRQRVPEWSGSDPSDFGVALIEAMAHLGDLLSYYNDRVASEAFITTAKRRESVIEHAKMLGYRPSGYRSSTLAVTVTNTTAAPITLIKGTRISAQVTSEIGNTVEPFELTSDTIIPASDSLDVVFRHGQTTYKEIVGMSTALPSLTYRLLDSPVVDDSVSVTVGSTVWTPVLHLSDYGPTDPVFAVSDDGSGNVTITFGDGISGAIPALHQQISATYVVGGGVAGNVPAGSISGIVFAPGLSEAQVMAANSVLTFANTTAATGGTDPESSDSIRWNAPLVGRAANRAVTVADHAALALAVPGVGAAAAEATDPFSVSVYIAPYRSPGAAEANPGGADGSSFEMTNLVKAVQEYLADKIMLGTTVTVVHPTYADAVVDLEITCHDNFLQAEVLQNAMEAFLATFAYNYMEFGQTIYRQDIESVLNQVVGVKVARINDLRHEHGGNPEWSTPDGATLVSRPDVIWVFKEAKIDLTMVGGVTV